MTLEDKNSIVFFRNNDLGEYQERVKNRAKQRKKKIKKRQAMLVQMFLAQAAKDENNLTDPYEFSVTPIPFAPAEPAPIGLNDGIYPREDLEGKPYSNLYYGILETHLADDGEDAEEDGKETEIETAIIPLTEAERDRLLSIVTTTASENAYETEGVPRGFVGSDSTPQYVDAFMGSVASIAESLQDERVFRDYDAPRILSAAEAYSIRDEILAPYFTYLKEKRERAVVHKPARGRRSK